MGKAQPGCVCNQGGWTRQDAAARAHDECEAVLHAWMASLRAGGSVMARLRSGVGWEALVGSNRREWRMRGVLEILMLFLRHLLFDFVTNTGVSQGCL